MTSIQLLPSNFLSTTPILITSFPLQLCTVPFSQTLSITTLRATCYSISIYTRPAATCVLRREPRRGPPPVGTITSLSRFITCHARAQERRKCARDLCRCASATRNIDLVQIQRLLVQTDEDLREASLGPPGNKCGMITHGQLQRSVTSRL